MKIIDNFLDLETFKNIKKEMLQSSGYFDWYYQDTVTSDQKINEGEFQFTHMFFLAGPRGFAGSTIKDMHANFSKKNYPLIEPIINKINPFSVVKVKANLLIKTEEIKKYDFHVDFVKEDLTTAIFYMNTCNGYTLFEDGTKVNSVENRLLEFDSKLKHTGTTCTDKNIRVVINFNYFK